MFVPRPLAALLAIPLWAAAADPAAARDPEVRVKATCGRSADAKLKVKGDDGMLELEFELEHSRTAGALWRVVIAREGRVEWRGSARARDGRFKLRRSLPGLPGADRVTIRASDPSGLNCTATATLPGAGATLGR
jgi:hypothetical protein